MKSLELVQQNVAGRLFLASLFLLTTTNGQPVDGEAQVTSADAKVNYDQRQSGKYNIRINIKDVAIIEMDNNRFGGEGLSEEDYYYDEEDLTVKPLKLTTPSTLFQSITSTSTKSTSMPTGFDFSQPPPTLLTRTTVQPIYNLQTSPDVTMQESITVKSKSLSSPESTQTLLEPRFAPRMVPKLISATETKLNSKIRTAQTSPSLTTVNQATQRVIESEGVSGKETFPTKSAKRSDSRVFKFMMQQTKKPLSFEQAKRQLRHCRVNQYLDLTGSCRNKRSASFLKKLLNIIATFPFVFAKDP